MVFRRKSGRMVVSRLKLSTGRRVGHIQLCLSEEGAESESPERATSVGRIGTVTFYPNIGCW